jgi:amino acid adenylation domain-containing protein
MKVMTIREAVDAQALARGASVFLLSPETGRALTFVDMQRDSVLLGAMLGAAGLAAGDKVALLMDNGLCTADLFLGAMYSGFVAVPLNVRAGAASLSYMLEHCDARVVFVSEAYRGLLAEAMESVRRQIRVIETDGDGALPSFETVTEIEAPAAVGPSDPAMLIYSSGSTGKPKGAVHTHSSVVAHGENSIAAHELTSADRSLLVLPLYHINAECVTLVPTLLSGGSVAVAHRFVVTKFWDWVEQLGISWSALVPTIVSELVDWKDEKDRSAAHRQIRFFRSSSAPLAPALQQQFLDKFPIPLLQAMGSTEGGNVFSNPQPPAKNKIGSPGLPWGFEARIVDREGAEVPQGESGEVLLRGAGLMRGYYKDPEGTAAVVDSQGWLHTGDLARQDEDGYFFVVGRSKELIIKGGVNIAPRQIDEVLESHAAVLEAAAVGVPDRYFGEDVVAFVVIRPEAATDERQLLAWCETRLGHFKTPSRIHFLKELPKGPSGKVQRLKLLDPAVLEAVAATAQPVAETPLAENTSGQSIEQIIAGAWAEVLGVPEVDPQTNFFALGGHSLMAIQCLSKLRDRLPIVLSLADFFENSTVAEQAALVRKRLHPAASAQQQESANWEQSLLSQFVPAAEQQSIPHLDPSEPHRLSPAQQGLWFLEQLNRDTPVYNESEAVRLTGELNVEALEKAMNMVVDAQPALRSTIQLINDAPHAVVHPGWPLRFKHIDLSALPRAEREAEAERLLVAEPRLPYRLEAEPGIRVTLLKLGAHEHVLILMMHHLVCDWASEGIIWRQLSAAYRALINGQAAALKAAPITFGDYAVYQHQQLEANSHAADLDYWEQTLKGAPPLLELPADRPRPPMMTYSGDRLRWKLNNTLTEALRDTSRREKTSLFTIFAAALDTLLFRYSGSEDILLGIPMADRDHAELDSVVGYLLRMHVLRASLSPDMSFRDLLTRVQKAALDMYLHRAAPFDQIVQRLKHERNLSYTPVFQVVLNWRDRDQMLNFIGLEGLAIESLMAHAATTKFDLLFTATDTGDEIWLELEYNTDLFDCHRIQRMLGHYQTVLEAVSTDTAATLATIPILSETERNQLLFGWNDTNVEYPRDRCLHTIIEDQTERTPEATAVVFEHISLTYRELNKRANQLARSLQELGVGPDTMVGICVERSLEMVVGLLGILKAGGAYVPLDPEYPKDRLSFMLDDAGTSILLTQSSLQQSLPPYSGKVISLDADWPLIAERDGSNVNSPVKPEHLAYMIYTSGSTGRPKGAMNTHEGIVNRLLWMQDEYRLTSSDRVLQKTPFSFDVSVWEFFWPLMTGACLVVARPGGHKDGVYLSDLIHKEKITTLHFVPSMLSAFLEQHGLESSCASVERVICSGEALPLELQERFFSLMPAELHNLYGPTEAAVDVTYWPCRRDSNLRSVPIGRPIANIQIYIVDRNVQPVPIGVPGELHIGGIGLARGYHKRPELTAEKFIANPFSSRPGARLYKTGDLARFMPDGSIEYLGRMDNQLKIRGLRVELGEIESVLAQHPAVREAAVVARQDTPGDVRLVAYVAAADDQVIPVLRNLLGDQLPEYMVPSEFVLLEKLPLTPNGKLDRKALPAPEVERPKLGAGRTAPGNPTEKVLAEIWSKALGLEKVGIHDNFFDLGGHSVLLARVQGQISRELAVRISIVEMYQYPTINSLAKRISRPSAESERLRKVHGRTRRRNEALSRLRVFNG